MKKRGITHATFHKNENLNVVVTSIYSHLILQGCYSIESGIIVSKDILIKVQKA